MIREGICSFAAISNTPASDLLDTIRLIFMEEWWRNLSIIRAAFDPAPEAKMATWCICKCKLRAENKNVWAAFVQSHYLRGEIPVGYTPSLRKRVPNEPKVRCPPGRTSGNSSHTNFCWILFKNSADRSMTDGHSNPTQFAEIHARCRKKNFRHVDILLKSRLIFAPC